MGGPGLRRAFVIRPTIPKDLAALALIAKAQIPEFQAPPKQVPHMHTAPPTHVSVSSTSITFGHFTDEEMDTLDRLLKKAGVPEHLLNPAPIDVDSQPRTEAQPSRGDGSPG